MGGVQILTNGVESEYKLPLSFILLSSSYLNRESNIVNELKEDYDALAFI